MVIDLFFAGRDAVAVICGGRLNIVPVAICEMVGDPVTAQCIVHPPNEQPGAVGVCGARPERRSAENVPVILQRWIRNGSDRETLQGRRAIPRQISIQQIHHAFLAAADQVRRARNQQRAGAAEIEVIELQSVNARGVPVVGPEPTRNPQVPIRIELDQCFVHIEGAAIPRLVGDAGVGAPAHLLLAHAAAGTAAGQRALRARVATFRNQASLFDDMGLIARKKIDHAAVVDDRAATALPDAAAGAEESAFGRQIVGL